MNAGDGQTGSPAAKVAIRPSVVVRDANSRAVPNVTVNFAVEAGGGTIDAGTAVTGSDGIATAGDWTLGSVEGENRLRATAGALTPIVFTASAIFPTILLADVTVPATGGTVRYDKPGDPLDGLALEIPKGAFSAPGHWRIETRSGATAPKRPGLTVTSVLIVSTDQGISDSALFLTIPAHTAPDSVTLPLAWDPASGRIEGLPIVQTTPTSVTIASRHFSSVRLLGPPAAAALRTAAPLGALPASLPMLISTAPLSATAAALAYQSGGIITLYDPFVDSWEFGNFGSYISPGGLTTGIALTEMYHYYASQPPIFSTQHQPIPQLFGTYNTQFKHFWAGNDRGYRVAAIAEADIDWTRTRADMAAIQSRGGATQDQSTFLMLMAAMDLSGLPQLLMVGGPPASGGFIAMLAFRISPTEVWLTDPNQPGATVVLPFANAHFGPLQISMMTGVPAFTATKYYFAGASAMIDFRSVAANFTMLLSGARVGDDRFPAYRIEYYDEDNTVWTDLPSGKLQVNWQDIQLRVFCPGCQRHLPVQPAGLVGLDVYDNGSQIPLATDRTKGFVKFRLPAGASTLGFHVLGGLDPCVGCPTVWMHVDFVVKDVSASQYSISPDPILGVSTTPIQLSVVNNGTGTPGNVRYFWEFGDGDTLTVDNIKTATHQWKNGTYTVKLSVTDLSIGKVIAKATAPVTIDQAFPVWRFTIMNEITFGHTVGDALGVLSGYVNNDIISLMEPIRAVPRTGRLFYEASTFTAGGQTLPAGVYIMGGYSTDTDISFLPGKPLVPLARPANGPYVDQFGDDLVIDAATQSGSLTSGTFSGKSATRYRDLSGFPGSGGNHTVSHWDVTATKNGTQLTGKITYYLEQWVLDPSTCVPKGSLNCQGGFAGTLRWEFPFTAVRVR